MGRAARGLAARLRREGLQKGDKVIFFSENRPEWIIAFWACLLEGIVVVPIDFRSSPDFLARVSRIVAAKLILVGQEVPPVGDTGGVNVCQLQDLAGSDLDFRPVGPTVENQDLTPISRDDVAEIIFTSGATAEPKGVVITHRNILANIVPVEREVVKYRKWGRPFFPLRFLNLLPLSHMFGQAMATFIPPMLPGVVIFMRGFNPAEIATQIRTRRVSVLVSVPKILDVLREYVGRASQARHEGAPTRGALRPHILQRHIVTRTLQRWWHYRHVHRIFGWKFWAFVVGAAPLETDLEAFWGEMGFAVIQGYGLTETAPIVTLNHPFGTKRGSVGKAIAGVEVKIAPDGEILVRGENVTTGYFGAPADTARTFEDGWFHTGDIGEVGGDGQLFIRGRKKEMIVTPEGLNVFPEDVERVLNRLPGVRESAVIGGEKNDRVHAVVIVDPGVAVDDRRAACERRARGPSEGQARPGVAGTGAATHRRHAQAETCGDCRVGPARRNVAEHGQRRRHLRGTAGQVRRSERCLRHDDDRRAGPELARARRADGRSGGRVRDTHRRGRVLRSARRVEAESAGRGGRRDCVRRRSNQSTFPRGTAPGRRAPFGASACRRGSCRPRAFSRGSASRASAPRDDPRPGHLRSEPPESHGHSGDSGGPAAAAALPRRAGDGQGILQGAFLSRRSTHGAPG